MIKINLLPPHILERRRVKAIAILLVAVLAIEVLGLMALAWGPIPGVSYASRLKAAEAREAAAVAAENEVIQLEAEVDAIKASYGAKGEVVTWVARADGRPADWVTYFNTLNQYIPADVVLNGLPLPSGTTLNLQGSTSDMMAAVRWYLNMLRCEMVSRDPNAVQFNPGSLSMGNPKMAMPVSMSVVLKPEWTDMMMAVATPSSIGGGAATRRGGGGRMGGGGGRGGGGGGRGGGMRGGGMRGGGMRGRGRRRGF
jgi:Tfp pilus assembly protein PilN